MEKKEAGRVTLGLYIDSGPLDRQAEALKSRLQGVFDGVSASAAGRFMTRAAPLRRAMEDWERQSSRLRESFSSLSQVMGQSFAIALTPAAEALNGFLASVLSAARTFRSFVYSLFGKKAPSAVEDTAEAFENVSAGSKSAGRSISGAGKEARRALMAFDEINRLNEDLAGSGGGGGGSGGGGGLDLSGLWDGAEELLAENPFGTLLRRMIEAGDYYGAGAALAAKVGEIVDALDEKLTDESFQARIRTALGGFTQGVNGFFHGLTFPQEGKETVAERLGDFVGDALGLGLESIHTVLSGIQWDTVGASIAQFVNGGIASLREKEANLGTVLADWLNMKLGALDGVLSGLDWENIGVYIAENVNSAFQGVDWETAGRTLVDGVRGLGTLAAAALRDIDWEENITAAVSGIANAIDPIDPDRTYTVDGRTYVNGQRTDGPEAISTAEAFGNLREAVRRALTGGTAVDENGFSHLSGKFALDVTADVTDARDSIPASKKGLGGFKATVTDKLDSIKNKGLSGFKAAITDKIDSIKAKSLGGFKAVITDKIDSIKNKGLSGFKAAITDKLDSIKAKTLDKFTAKFTEAKNGLTEAKRTIATWAKWTSTKQGLTEDQRTIKTWAEWGSTKQGLTKDQRTIKTWAEWGSTKQSLTEAQRTIKTWAEWGSTKQGLTEAQRTIKTWAEWGSTKDSLTEAKKTIGVTAKYTEGIDAIPESDKKIGLKVTSITFSEDVKAALRAAQRGEEVAAGGGIWIGGAKRPIQAYASGGMPRGSQLFWARESGPELVGTLGGHTAVMNNDQIVASVSAGVARAIAGIRFYAQNRGTPHLAVIGQSVSRSEQHLASMDSQMRSGAAGSGPELAGLLRQIIGLIRDIDVNAYLDGDEVTDRVVKRINARTRATGVCEIMV